jgi:hypothetical protein
MYEGREGYVVTAQGLDFFQKHSELIQMLRTYGSIKKTEFSPQVSVKKT